MYGIDGSLNSRTSCKTYENTIKCQKYNTSFKNCKKPSVGRIGVCRADFGPPGPYVWHSWSNTNDPGCRVERQLGSSRPRGGAARAVSSSTYPRQQPGCYVTTFHRIRCNSVEKRKGVLLAAHRHSKLNEKWNKVHLCVSISNPAAELQRVFVANGDWEPSGRLTWMFFLLICFPVWCWNVRV